MFLAGLHHRVQIYCHFGGSPTSCMDPQLFRLLSSIMLGSPFFSVALHHRVWISYVFLWLSDIGFGSPIISMALRHHVCILFLFGGYLTLWSDPLSFQRFSGIMFESPIVCGELSSIMFGSPIISVALWHHVRIPYHFENSLASCSDPLSFWQLSNIVFKSLFFWTTLQHRVPIPYLLGCFLISCLDPLWFR